jgi:hypothetical protein
MRPALSAALCLVAIAACADPNTKIVPSMVQWMDWPAEVNAGESFRTRIVVWGVCASNPRFRPGVNADQSAVTFAPYFIIDDDNVVCAAARVESVVISAIDTAGIAPGLLAFRTYEMRGSWHGYIRGPAGGALLPNLPVRTFGEVGVRPSGADPARRNAAGYIRVARMRSRGAVGHLQSAAGVCARGSGGHRRALVRIRARLYPRGGRTSLRRDARVPSRERGGLGRVRFVQRTCAR